MLPRPSRGQDHGSGAVTADLVEFTIKKDTHESEPLR